MHMRKEVMYPDRSLAEMFLPEDESGWHPGIWLGNEVIAVVSVFSTTAEGTITGFAENRSTPFVGGGPTAEDSLAPEQWQFRKFACSNHHQGRGWGSLLLQYIFFEASQRGVLRIWCNARVAVLPFYQKFGMQAYGDSWEQWGVQFVKMDRIFLEKVSTPGFLLSAPNKQNLNSGKMEIIPAIDIIEGKCVRLTQGDYSLKTVYNENPLEVALQFQDAGVRRLHLVDLDGAKAGKVTNWKVLEMIANRTNLIIDFGGGIKKEEDVKVVLDSGAALATVGSIAVKNPEVLAQWLLQFGPDKFLLGADVKEEKIAVSGWLETSDLEVIPFIQGYLNKGLFQVFCTDVSKDGLLQGPALELYKKILDACKASNENASLHFIASGGVSSLNDLKELKKIGCHGAIVGKAIYEGRISMKELADFH